MAATISKKRTLDSFFTPKSSKKARLIEDIHHEPANTADSITQSENQLQPSSQHSTYPFPIPHLRPQIINELSAIPASSGKEINNKPDLDLLYFQPYIPRKFSTPLFNFLRSSLFFYRVKYKIKRGAIETEINTPRYTTVFGVDSTSLFTANGVLIDSITKSPIPSDRYRTCQPRPIPSCLDELRKRTEECTGASYNFCLVNYYASGVDSISYHSDDERFLGPSPSIASLSLGANRDFCMKHKPVPPSTNMPPPCATPFLCKHKDSDKPLKLPLTSRDMVLMRGSTQAKWLHSIPKRKGAGADEGRINITFRRALEKGGTENYYRYNVGSGVVWKWDGAAGEMRGWVGVKEVEALGR